MYYGKYLPTRDKSYVKNIITNFMNHDYQVHVIDPILADFSSLSRKMMKDAIEPDVNQIKFIVFEVCKAQFRQFLTLY